MIVTLKRILIITCNNKRGSLRRRLAGPAISAWEFPEADPSDFFFNDSSFRYRKTPLYLVKFIFLIFFLIFKAFKSLFQGSKFASIAKFDVEHENNTFEFVRPRLLTEICKIMHIFAKQGTYYNFRKIFFSMICRK